MDNVVKYFNTIESSFKKTKIAMLACVAVAVISMVSAFVYTFSYISSHSDNIYLIDTQGNASSATKVAEDALNKSYEVQVQLDRFHRFMFSLSPSTDAINTSLESAFLLCDDSAFSFYKDWQEKQYYSRLVSTNTTQYFIADSIKVNMDIYPYQTSTYGKVYVMRESNVTMYDLKSTGRVVEIGRSKSNPAGLMIEQFNLERYEAVETKRRR